MNNRLSGREPVQIAELVQPLCGNVFSKGRCAGGSGLNSEQTMERWLDGNTAGWTGVNGTLGPYGTGGGIRYTINSLPAWLISPTFSSPFSGSTFRYIIVRGRARSVMPSLEWYMQYADYTAGTDIAAVNQAELAGLADGEDFVAIFDASTSADYATKWQGQSLDHYRLNFRNSVTAGTDIEIYSITAATENPQDNVGRECYNTLASCESPTDYNFTPEELYGTDLVGSQGELLDIADFVRFDSFFFGVDVFFPESGSSGVITEVGGTEGGMYLGVTSGDLIFRAGDGSTGGKTPNNGFLQIDAGQFDGKRVTFLGVIDFGNSKITLYAWDAEERTVTDLGTSRAESGFSNNVWAGGASAGVGTIDTSYIVGMASADWNGRVEQFRGYNSAQPLTLTNPYAVNLFFSHGTVAARTIEGLPYVIPALTNVSTAPARMNLAGAGVDAQGIGNRALIGFTFSDFPHTDRLVDPYLANRQFNPLEVSTFWPKWTTRNFYRYNMLMRSYEGYAGDALSDMVKRQVLLNAIEGPDENGRTVFRGRDPLGLIEDRKAQVPRASSGELLIDITDNAGVLQIAGASSSEYADAGYVRINDEIIRYTGKAVGVNNSLELTGLIRGQERTTPAGHEAGDTVQQAVKFSPQTVAEAVRALLLDWGGLPYNYLDHNGLERMSEVFLPLFLVGTILSEPTSVTTLISELQEQCGFNLWWDERARLVRFKAVRGITEIPPLLTDSAHLLENSFKLADVPRKRISQLWFYFSRKTGISEIEKPASYRESVVIADLPSEGPAQFGTPSVKRIYGRWIDGRALAETTTRSIVKKYSIVPREATFALDAKDADLWVGDVVRLSHYSLVDKFGARKIENWTITSAQVVDHGDTIVYTAENTASYGQVTQIQETGAPDYQPGDSKFIAWIGDENGLLSDGTESSKVG